MICLPSVGSISEVHGPVGRPLAKCQCPNHVAILAARVVVLTGPVAAPTARGKLKSFALHCVYKMDGLSGQRGRRHVIRPRR